MDGRKMNFWIGGVEVRVTAREGLRESDFLVKTTVNGGGKGRNRRRWRRTKSRSALWGLLGLKWEIWMESEREWTTTIF